MFVDVDNLKGVNDALGHRAGDLLLQEVTRRMKSELRPGDTLARLAGDEFVVVCEDLTLRAQAEEVAERILTGFHAPFDLDGLTVSSSVSIGLTFARQGTVTAEQALADADAAMYRAKSLGGARWTTTGPVLQHVTEDGGDGLAPVATAGR